MESRTVESVETCHADLRDFVPLNGQQNGWRMSDGPRPGANDLLRPLEGRLLKAVLKAMGDPRLSLVLWDGQELTTSLEPAVARVVITDRKTLWKIIRDPMFELPEGYTEGRVLVEGDFVAALLEVEHAMRRSGRSRLRPKAPPRRRSSIVAARDNIHQHYDLGNEFYKLWLDERMVYTCAYYPDPTATLDQAQFSKLDYVCRKMKLQPGERVIEAGCGWGALALHMARHYGVTVRAYNISHEQIVYAREEACRQGLADRVDFIEDDWRHIRGECDAFVSVGMLEHVGPYNYRELGDVIDRVLAPAGRGLIHSIGRNQPRPVDKWISRRIFPGGYCPTLREMMEIFEPNNLSVRDVENLRLHYAQTLRHWLERFECSVDHVRGMFGDNFVRAWRLYLSGSIAAFLAGSMQLFQVVFSRDHETGSPTTRGYLYTEPGTALPAGDA